MRFDVRTTSLTADMMASMDDGGSIEIFTPDPNIGARSTVRLTIDGFSSAYAKLREACDNLAGLPPDTPPTPDMQMQPNDRRERRLTRAVRWR